MTFDKKRCRFSFILTSVMAVWTTLVSPASANTDSFTDSFDIRIEAPAEVRELLERHLQLQRFRAVSDLEDAELARLMLLADSDVRNLLGTLGYFSPDVHISRSIAIAPPAQARTPTILIKVALGVATRTTQADLRFKGDIANTLDTDAARQRDSIQLDWRLPTGQPFTQDGWDAAKTQALRQLVARRYPAGSISYSLADIDPATNAAALTVELDSGPLYRLGELKVSGLERYDPVLVPRLARLNPGDIYDQRKLVEAQQRLAGSGYFDSAYVLVDPDSDPSAAPVSVQLREAKLQKVVLGIGMTTDTGPRASIEHTHNRVPGLDWRAVTKLQLDRKTPLAQTEWTSLPDADNWRWVLLARVARLDDDELVTNAQTLRFGQVQTGERIDRTTYLQYDRATVTASGTASTLDDARIGDGSALTANYGWTGRYFDSLPFPTRGYGLGFDAGAGTTLGTQRQPFLRAVGRWLGIAPLARGRMAFRAEGGAVIAAKDATVPATQLFRTGGDTTVRGYGLRDIGIALPNGSTGPGHYMAVASAEWQRPILSSGLPTDWESTLFIDAGNVADSAADLRRNVAVGVGAGARWKSPIGPLQIDLAYGVKTQQVRLHVSVGFVF
ncbi:MAG: BamA/TamA family outer membrane protein [Polaromonas sp.]|nr:BamA/TamA family outer membrane protein [Polaromonas sp.]